MADNTFVFIIILLAVLAFVLVFFAVVDRLLKGGTAKKTPEKKPTSKPVSTEKAVEQPAVETKIQPTMKIYNSELADDLNAMLKDAKIDQSSRLQIEKHIERESNISKYIQSKNYHGFNFDTDTATDNDEEPLTFTREDYKRFMALSNIDDKK